MDEQDGKGNVLGVYKIKYDWDEVAQFTAERNMMARGIILNEKEGLQESDEKIKIDVVRRMDQKIEKLQVEVPAFKVITQRSNF